MSTESISDSSSTIVIGSGISGTSVAYWLTAMGADDVTVLGQGSQPAHSEARFGPPHAIVQTAPSEALSKTAQTTRQLAQALDAFNQTGSVEIATTKAHGSELRHRPDHAAAYGVSNPELLSADAVTRQISGVNGDRIDSGYHSPSDGLIDRGEFLDALRHRASEMGVRFIDDAQVTAIETHNRSVDTVKTDDETFDVDRLILTDSLHAPRFAEMLGVDLPLVSFEYLYGVIDSPTLDSVSDSSPLLLLPEEQCYLFQQADQIGIAYFGTDPTPIDPSVETESTGASPSPYTVREPSPEEFTEILSTLEELVPGVESATITEASTGSVGITPDGNPLLGAIPERDGCWIAAGLRPMHAGGAGRALASLILEDSPEINVNHWLVSRLQPHVGSQHFLHEQGRETFQRYPGLPITAGEAEGEGKTLRESPFFRYQRDLGANFYDLRYGGWKRPMSYDVNEALIDEFEIPSREGRSDDWSPIPAAEHLGVRNRVGMCDLTSFSTFEVVGQKALEFSQEVFSNDVDIPIGNLRYTLMLDRQGGILGDMTVYRRGEEQFHVISNSGGAGTKQVARLKRRARGRQGVYVEDQINRRCGISVTGPNARAMLNPIVEADLATSSFPFFGAAETYVEDIPVLACRVSYVGDLGWELHTSMDYGAELWDILWEAGQEHGVLPFGDGALVSLRLEKGYPAYGMDVYPDYTPVDANLMHAVDMDTDFIGRDRLKEQLETGDHQERCILTLDDPAATVGGGRPVFDGEDKVGYVTTTGEAYYIDEFVINAYLDTEYSEPGSQVEIQYRNDRYAATVKESPLLDPENQRLRQ